MLEKSFILSFIAFAIWYCLLPGEIFGKVGEWLEKHLPKKLHDPVFACPVCLSFWYGTAIYWTVWHVGILDWLLTVIVALGINAVLVKTFPQDPPEPKD